MHASHPELMHWDCERRTCLYHRDLGLLPLLTVSSKVACMTVRTVVLHSHTAWPLQQSSPPCRYNNRTYRIDDIAWDKNPQSTFLDHTGQSVSFIEYYK